MFLKRVLSFPIKFMLHIYWLITRGLTLGARAVIVDSEGRIFLIRHTYISGWHLPGGGVEAGETVCEALKREVREEASIRITGEPEFFGVFLNRIFFLRDHVLLYIVREFSIEEIKKPDSEIAEAGFFALSGLPENVTPGTLKRINEVFYDAPKAKCW